MADLHLRLGPNFPLREALFSATALRDPALLAQQHDPPPEVVANLVNVVYRCLQPARDELRVPIHVTSGYRCPALNARVKGSPNSQHMAGQAFDVRLPPAFAHSQRPQVAALRARIAGRVLARTGRPVRPGVNANYYLFAYLALNRRRFHIDQLIHEYGTAYGEPGWVHVSCRPEDTGRKEILAYGGYVRERSVDLAAALAFGTDAYA